MAGAVKKVQSKLVCKLRYKDNVIAYVVTDVPFGCLSVYDGAVLGQKILQCQKFLTVEGLTAVKGSSVYVRSTTKVQEYAVNCTRDEIVTDAYAKERQRLEKVLIGKYAKYVKPGRGVVKVSWGFDQTAKQQGAHIDLNKKNNAQSGGKIFKQRTIMIASPNADNKTLVVKLSERYVTGVRLLTHSEFKKYFDRIRPAEQFKTYECGCWWLDESAGIKGDVYNHFGDHVGEFECGSAVEFFTQHELEQNKCVSHYIDDECDLEMILGIRPVLSLRGIFNVGERFKHGGYYFTVISDDLALCDTCIGECAFEDVAAKWRNRLQNWLVKAGKSIKK